ncbi:XRE family transcriptional regulator [Buttiauxella warmboldiae]|uniref:XRE family transcriptional regulator n=1 Tax=Buttiauxella warmboldiae TaxID=82993 RepID=A0A3N5DKT1_9ENTR|nr:helix-turn-helix transcriptional regulator [Buttiauxella warmboldiae]RPH29255.1 XRE family transcriptional regulator [Buttiauxella warmboldiae]
MKTTNHYNDIFCRRLKQARLASGLSQKRLGIAAGIDEFVASTRINRYEKGVHEPNAEIMQKLAEVLRVPLAYFYAEDNDLAELMLIFFSLSGRQREELMDYAKHRVTS